MKRFGGENGQTLIMVAVSLSVVLGFVAFATDLGVVLHQKRLAQTAADSAAIAAAKYLDAGSADAVTAGKNDAAANGFTSGSGGVTVTITPSPTSGAFTGSQYVRATVSQSVPTIFSSIFNVSALTVGATAVAGLFPSNGCVYVLKPSGASTMNLQGSFDVSTPGCGVLVDSTDPNALSFVGGSGTLKAAYVNVVGGTDGHTGDSTPAPVTGVAPMSDPLAIRDLPSYEPGLTASCSSLAPASGTSTNPATLAAGCWQSSGDIVLDNVYLTGGVYVFNNPGHNVVVEGTVTDTMTTTSGTTTTTTTNPVTLYMLGGLNATANSTITLSAPNDDPSVDPYSGIVMYTMPNSGSPSQTIEFEMGNATGTVVGIIYGPAAEFYVHDSGGDKSGGTTSTMAFNTDLVVNTFNDQTGDLSIISFGQTHQDSPLSRIALVE